MTNSAFDRMYVDLPPDTKAKLKVRAAELGTSMKALVAQLIEQECATKRKVTYKRKRSKK